MICYLTDMNTGEIEAINDYWLTCDTSSTGFCYTIKQIDAKHKSEQVRSISFLVKNSNFLASHPAFSCEDCLCKFPIKNRASYQARMRLFNNFLCCECLDIRKIKVVDEAREVIQQYKDYYLQETFDLESLSIEEVLALLSISAGRVENSDKFLCESPDDISITGISTIDINILSSFVRKGVLTYIHELPKEVQNAYKVLYGDFERLTYDRGYKKSRSYRNSDRIISGIYLNNPKLEDGIEVSNVSTVLYQKLQTSILSIDEVTRVNNIIKEIQLDKLYKLVQEISKEYVLPIDNSNVLNALLDHLAGKYSPLSINFTFNIQARDTIVYIRKKPAPDYIEKNYFTKFVGDYIQHIENKGWTLMKNWSLPPAVFTSSFEAIFSKIYLNEHFDWNMLSASEVVALWLKNVRFSENVQNLLTEGDGTQ